MRDLAPLRRRVFAQCRALGLDDEARREAQLAATGKASMTEMSAADLGRLASHLEARGARAAPRSLDPRPDQRLIHVIWRLLAEAGAVKPGRRALRSFIANSNFHAKWGEAVTDVRFLSVDRARDVIEALKDMCARHGVRLDLPGERR